MTAVSVAGALIEQIIDWVSGVDLKFQLGAVHVSPMFFDGAEPLLPDLPLAAGNGYDDQVFIDATPELLSAPLDVRILTPGEATDGHELSVQRVRAMRARDVRGRVHPFLPHPIEWTVALLHTRGEGARQYYGRAGERHWVALSEARGYRATGARWTSEEVGLRLSPEQASFRVQLALGMQFTRRYQWRVYFALDDKPGIELPTDPIGAREAFRLRDIPAGRARRAALKHWVEEHWRQDRRDPSEELKVREHLRGAQQFDWSGLRCRITPSEFDQERAEHARIERERLRQAGLDRRPRAIA